jgi:hypothetical protein
MDINAYRPRIIDEAVKQYLRTFGAVCIEGPKWCGNYVSTYISGKPGLRRSIPTVCSLSETRLETFRIGNLHS